MNAGTTRHNPDLDAAFGLPPAPRSYDRPDPPSTPPATPRKARRKVRKVKSAGRSADIADALQQVADAAGRFQRAMTRAMKKIARLAK